jgi:type II secretory pathway component PulF
MAVFTYRALNDQAAAIEGTIAADTARAARDALRSRGLLVESMTTSSADSKSIRLPLRRRQRYASKRVAMVRELSTMLAAGIPLLEAIDSLVQQQTGGFKQSMMVLRDRVAAGGSLADAMREQPDVFDPLTICQRPSFGNSSPTRTSIIRFLGCRGLRSLVHCSSGGRGCRGSLWRTYLGPAVVRFRCCR